MKAEDLTVELMVFQRLTFLEETDKNRQIIASFALEVAYELEPCFRIDDIPVPEGTTDENGNPVYTYVGDFTKYKFLQRSIIADLVCIQLLVLRTMKDVVGTVETESGGKVMTKAKAGSVEVEWEQVDVKKSANDIAASNLMDYYMKAAKRKALQFFCILDWFDNNLSVVLNAMYNPSPFIVQGSGDCGCNGSSAIVEQG